MGHFPTIFMMHNMSNYDDPELRYLCLSAHNANVTFGLPMTKHNENRTLRIDNGGLEYIYAPGVAFSLIS